MATSIRERAKQARGNPPVTRDSSAVLNRASALAWIVVPGTLFLISMTSPETISVSDVAMIFALGIVAVGQNVVTAMSGQMSIGQGGFVAVGAYAFAVLWQHYELPAVVAFLVAPLIAGLVGVIVGGAALKLDGLYLAMVTLALVVSIPQLIKWVTLAPITGGSQGILLPPVSTPDWLSDQDPSIIWLFLAAAVFAVVAFMTAQLRRSRHGLGLRMMRESDLSATLSGVSRTRARISAFVISAVFAGLGGELLVLITGIVTPDSYTLMFSFQFLVIVVLGGMGSTLGALLGAAITWELQIHLSTGVDLSPVGINIDILPWVVYGVVVIAVVLFFPYGLVGGARRLMSWLTRRRDAPTRDEQAEVTADD